MAESLLDGAKDKEEKGSSKKVYALALIVIVLMSFAGFLLYTGYGGILPLTTTVNSPDEAADTLSGLGNDLNELSDDLKDMENLL